MPRSRAQPPGWTVTGWNLRVEHTHRPAESGRAGAVRGSDVSRRHADPVGYPVGLQRADADLVADQLWNRRVSPEAPGVARDRQRAPGEAGGVPAANYSQARHLPIGSLPLERPDEAADVVDDSLGVSWVVAIPNRTWHWVRGGRTRTQRVRRAGRAGLGWSPVSRRRLPFRATRKPGWARAGPHQTRRRRCCRR